MGSAYPTETFKSHVGTWSYNEDATDCVQDEVNRVDPISLLTRMYTTLDIDGDLEVEYDYAAEQHHTHHGWETPASAGQYFHNFDYGGCLEGLFSLADRELVAEFGDRFHVRGHIQHVLGEDRPEDTDPFLPATELGAWTPHFDKQVWCDDLLPGHAVPQDFYGDGSNQSGFEVARDKLMQDWFYDGGSPVDHHMNIVDPQGAVAAFYGNIQQIEQCNGWLPSSDGWVWYIGLDPNCAVCSWVP